MKITVETNKNTFGKKVGYVASFGQFQETGITKEEAKQNLITALEWYFNEFDYPHNITFKVIPESGVTLYMLRTFEGYEIRTVCHDGRPSIGTSLYGRLSHREALERLNSHVEGYQTEKTV